MLALAAAFALSYALVRMGAGFGVDERTLDYRFNNQTRAEIGQEAAAQSSAAGMADYGRRLVRGDLGESTVFSRPVAELIRERAPETLPALGMAWVLTLAGAVAGALAATMRPTDTVERAFSGSSALLLAVPCGVLALVFAWLRLPVTAALVIAVLPQAYRYTAGVLEGAIRRMPVVAARSRGVSGPRLWVRYVLLPSAPELLGVMGLTVNLLIGAVIPIEALTGASGLGHLVWQAALGRDLPLIAATTFLVAAATLAAGSSAEIAAAVLRARRSA